MDKQATDTNNIGLITDNYKTGLALKNLLIESLVIADLVLMILVTYIMA
jgi:hypothetical protein